MAYFIPSRESLDLVDKIISIALIIQRDGKASSAYLGRRMGMSENEADYICSVLERMGLLGDDENLHRSIAQIIKPWEAADAETETDLDSYWPEDDED